MEGTRYLIYGENSTNYESTRILIGNPAEYIYTELPEDFDEENFDCYSLINEISVMNIVKLKEKRKKEARTKRKELFEILDGMYFDESEKIYQKESFKKTPEMDEIFRKKKVLRDLPATIDALTTIDDVKSFVVPLSINDL